MGFIWRFYVDQEHRWRWQRMTADRAVVAESRKAYKEYEKCLDDAKDDGYVFQTAQPKLLRTNSR